MTTLQSGSGRIWWSACVVVFCLFVCFQLYDQLSSSALCCPCATLVFNFLVTPWIPDIVNLPLNKPSQAMTNSHGDLGCGWRGGDWLDVGLACSSVGLPGQRGLCIRSECSVFRATGRGITGNMTWHSFWTRPFSPPVRRSLHPPHLPKTFSPAERPHPTPLQPEWHYHHN